MRPIFAAALLVAAGATTAPLIARTAPPMAEVPGTHDPQRVKAGRYSADPHHTLVQWRVDHLGFTPYFGLFGDVTGTLEIDPQRLSQAKVDVSIPVSKVTTASAGLTAHLLKPPAVTGDLPDFFGGVPEPARFVSTTVKVTGKTKAQVTGDLTLNGVTRPVTLNARFYGAGAMPADMGGQENLGFEATAAIRRSDFGLGYSVPLVSDVVTLDIAAAFIKDAP